MERRLAAKTEDILRPTGPPPPPHAVHDIGILFSGAINLFNRAVNEQHGWGTLWWQENLTNVRSFDPSKKYPVGTILGYPFERDNDGHVIIVSTEPDANGDQWTIGADTPFELNEKRTVKNAHDTFNLTYAGEIAGVGVIPLGQSGAGESAPDDPPGPPPYVMLDSLVCPSLDQLERIWNHTNVWAYGFYLPEAPSHPWSYYRGRRQSFVDLGFGLAPIYVGQQLSGPGSKILTESQGKKDAQDAAERMKAEGFPKGDVCYLDVEGGNWSAALVAYAAAWINETNNNTDYTAGMYALPNVADAIMVKAPRAIYWACRADYACSWDAGAKVYQGAEGSDEYWRFHRPDHPSPQGDHVAVVPGARIGAVFALGNQYRHQLYRRARPVQGRTAKTRPAVPATSGDNARATHHRRGKAPHRVREEGEVTITLPRLLGLRGTPRLDAGGSAARSSSRAR